jgi:excisionase family DNA binding protein
VTAGIIPLLVLKFIMEKYGVDRTTVYRWIKQGMPSELINGTRWMFIEEDVHNWLTNRKKGKKE